MNGPVVVEFRNVYGSSRVLRRQFQSTGEFHQWLDANRSAVELVSVRPLPEASEVVA